MGTAAVVRVHPTHKAIVKIGKGSAQLAHVPRGHVTDRHAVVPVRAPRRPFHTPHFVDSNRKRNQPVKARLQGGWILVDVWRRADEQLGEQRPNLTGRLEKVEGFFSNRRSPTISCLP